MVRFLTMETGFYISLKANDLEDKQNPGELSEQTLDIIRMFPPEKNVLQSGYVGITFKAPGDELRLWFTQMNAKATLENGLQSKELFDAL